MSYKFNFVIKLVFGNFEFNSFLSEINYFAYISLYDSNNNNNLIKMWDVVGPNSEFAAFQEKQISS